MRIAIFGRPGSGKSTFSIRLGTKLGIPVYHLDNYFFNSGWQERPSEDFLKEQREIVVKEKWIIDGNSLQSLRMRYIEADIVIYFYLPMHICMLRVIKRFFYRDPEATDRPKNCAEKIDRKLIKYMWNFGAQAQARGRLDFLRQTYRNTLFYKIRNDKEATELMDTLLAEQTQNTCTNQDHIVA